MSPLATTSWQKIVSAIAASDRIPETLKVLVVCIAIGESGRGVTWVSTHLLNFWSLKFKDGFGVEGVLAPDGYLYMKFTSFVQAVRIFWARIHLSPYYDGVDAFWNDPRGFLNKMGPAFCPPGYPGSPSFAKWFRDHGNRNYTDYILSFWAEAEQLLLAVGWERPQPVPQPDPVPVPVDPMPNAFRVVGDKLEGAIWRPVKNFDRIRINPLRGMVHYTAALEGEDVERGTMAGWDNILTRASAHVYILRDGRTYQCVPLIYRAWGAGIWNPISWHLELESIGCFFEGEKKARSWWDPKTGRFCRWFLPGIVRSAPMSEFVLLRHPKESGFRWWHTFTEKQVAAAIGVLRAWRDAAPGIRFVGHDEYEPRRLDPFPFPWEQVRAALA